jgi:hypothetical protein
VATCARLIAKLYFNDRLPKCLYTTYQSAKVSGKQGSLRMTFRFQIIEAGRARKPIVVLIGKILEGEVNAGDRLVIPLSDGTEFVGTVMGILHQYPDTKMYSYANCEEKLEAIGIGVWRSDCHKADDIADGVATNAPS